jgi:hypothetical protein
VHAFETGLFRVTEIEVGEEAPDPQRHVADQGLLDPAEPTDEPGQHASRDAVREQEVQIVLLHKIHYD